MWSYMKWIEVVWSEVVWSEVMWSEGNGIEVKRRDMKPARQILWAKSQQWSEVTWIYVKWCGVKWSDVTWWEWKWSDVKWREVMWNEGKGSDMKWREGKWSNDLRWNWFSYVAVQCPVISLLFASICHFLITRLTVFNVLFMFIFLFCIFVFYFVYSVFLYCFSFCALSLSLSLPPILVQIYRPLPPGGNPIAVNKYIISISHWEKMSPNKMTIIHFSSFIKPLENSCQNPDTGWHYNSKWNIKTLTHTQKRIWRKIR